MGVQQGCAPGVQRCGPGYGEAVFELGVTDTVSTGSATTQEYRISDTANVAEGRMVKLFTGRRNRQRRCCWRTASGSMSLRGWNGCSGHRGFPFGEQLCMNGSSFAPRGEGEPSRVRTAARCGRGRVRLRSAADGERVADADLIVRAAGPRAGRRHRRADRGIVADRCRRGVIDVEQDRVVAARAARDQRRRRRTLIRSTRGSSRQPAVKLGHRPARPVDDLRAPARPR